MKTSLWDIQMIQKNKKWDMKVPLNTHSTLFLLHSPGVTTKLDDSFLIVFFYNLHIFK